jgi:hypothetical protein
MPSDPTTDFGTPVSSVTRETLYHLVWAQPMLKVAAQYGVSSSYLARVCSAMNVPRPERGYWAKLAVNKAPAVPALPEVRPGDQVAWTPGGGPITVARPPPRPPDRQLKRKSKLTIPVPDEHPLLTRAKALFEGGRLSYEGDYLKPAKKLLVDLVVTKTGLDKALAFANQFFLELEAKGHRVVIAPYAESFAREEVDEREEPAKNRGYNNLWSPGRCTVAYLGTVALGLTIIEMSEQVAVRYVGGEYVRETDYVPPKRSRYTADNTWTTKKPFPTARLCLQVYSPYWRAKWVRRWRETKDRDLTDQISTIVRELERAVVDVARLVEEGERQAEFERQRWEEESRRREAEEAELRAARALKESKDELLNIIEQWAQSRRIQEFFFEVESESTHLAENSKNAVSDRLRVGRHLLGDIKVLDRFIHWKSPEERLRSPETDKNEADLG